MEDRNVRGETESQPLILPFALRQLQESASVWVRREFSCCWSVYSVSCPDAGTLFTLEGVYGLGLKDNNGKKLARVQRPLRLFAPLSLRVWVGGSARAPLTVTLTLGAQARSSQALLLQDGGRTVLRVRKPAVVMHHSLFEIMSNTTNTPIGSITKEGSDYEVRFPDDTPVRYKVALITACFYIDTFPTVKPRRRHTVADGGRPPSNTYVNFQDTLFNSLRISETFACTSST